MPYKEIVGDLFEHLDEDSKKYKIGVPHVCNNQGKWGAGFVLALSKYDPFPEECYRRRFAEKALVLGRTISADSGSSKDDESPASVIVFNMIAQTLGGARPLRYAALGSCMYGVAAGCVRFGIQHIYCPKFGSGLAGGDWKIIESMIQECWVDEAGLDVTVFKLE